MKRKGSINHHFNQRIPADIKARAVGLELWVPIGDAVVSLVITDRMNAIRLSLRTSEPAEVKRRQAAVVAYVESVWRSLRQPAVTLTHKQAVALSRAAYRQEGFADLGPEYAEGESAYTGKPGVYASAIARLDNETDPTGKTTEDIFLAMAEKLLVRHGLANVATDSKAMLAHEIRRAMRDGGAAADMQDAGDYTPDPKATRFPPLELPSTAEPRLAAQAGLTNLVDEWWKEAKSAGRALSTYEAYKSIFKSFTTFLQHDDATRVTAADVLAFKDARLAAGIDPRTVGDGDLACLRSVFKWAVANHRMASNPAEDVKVMRQKRPARRERSLTLEEGRAVLAHSLRHNGGRRNAKRLAAQRWVPWLCAYTGARVGELVQMRKQDLRKQGDIWVITITPEAGTVKGKESREVVLHDHLVDQGFPEFVAAAPAGHLFVTPGDGGDSAVKAVRTGRNRLAEFVREVVKDPDVAPNHGWRHLFKTIGREVGIADSVLDAICGHAAKTVGGSYGGVTLKAQGEAIARFPKFDVK